MSGSNNSGTPSASGGGMGHPAAGTGGGTVTTDGVTIQGNGSGGSPIAAKASAALTPDPKGYFSALFQQKTGLSPLLFTSYYEDFLYQATLQPADYSAFPSGTGATATWLISAGSGIMQLLGCSAGAGQCDWSTAVRTAGPYPSLANIRTKRWLCAYRIASGKAPSGNSQTSIGMTVGTTFFGLGYVGAVSNWNYVRGVDGSVANILDTGKAITNEVPPANTGYLWVYLYNDLTNIRYCIDVVGGVAEAIAEASTSIPSNPGSPYIYNKGNGSGAADKVFFDTVVFCGER